MWFLIPIAGLLIAGIVALVTEDESNARKNWESKYESAKSEVENLSITIDRHLSTARTILNFYELNNFYFASFKSADSAYKLLTDSRVSLTSIKRMINAANEKRFEIKDKLSMMGYSDEKFALINELRDLTEFKNKIQEDFNKVLEQKQSLAVEVTRLNQQTEKLKIAMRDRCGPKGREWHGNLTQRISSRRLI